MIVLYVGAAVVYILINAGQIPAVLGQIIAGALQPAAAFGGFVGASVAQVIAAGVSRGVLSNEAGMGSAPIAHGIAKVKHLRSRASSASSRCSWTPSWSAR